MFEFLEYIKEGKNKHLDNDEEFLIFWKNSPVVSCCKEVINKNERGPSLFHRSKLIKKSSINLLCSTI